jgi:hypothetical protein
MAPVNMEMKEIFGFHRGEYEIYGFKGSCNAECGGWIPTFWRTMLPSSSGLKCKVNRKWT